MSLIEQLRAMGFRVEVWPIGLAYGEILSAIEITDLATAASVYVSECSTLHHCLEMIETKNKAFVKAQTSGFCG